LCSIRSQLAQVLSYLTLIGFWIIVVVSELIRGRFREVERAIAEEEKAVVKKPMHEHRSHSQRAMTGRLHVQENGELGGDSSAESSSGSSSSDEGEDFAMGDFSGGGGIMTV
jgi:hypothetical protein